MRAAVAVDESITDSPVGKELDWAALAKYVGATAFEVGAMVLTLAALQNFVMPYLDGGIARTAVACFFGFCALRSRVFSPLDARRPTVGKEKQAIQERRRPSWMPPALVFPIVWTTIAVLRAVSSMMVWEACGRNLLAVPLIGMMTHLAIGDTWNYINNTQKKLGVAVPGVLCVLGSVICVDALYLQASQQAGLVLAPSVVWLSIASCLVFSIWRLNKPEENPLYPTKA